MNHSAFEYEPPFVIAAEQLDDPLNLFLGNRGDKRKLSVVAGRDLIGIEYLAELSLEVADGTAVGQFT